VTPASARASLDRWLQKAGQTVTVQQIAPGNPPTVASSISVRAHIRDFTPRELDGSNGLQIGDSKVIMSTTTPIDADMVLKKGDRVIAGGRTRTVLYGWAAPHIGDEIVRVEAVIR
jgi:hypothetical protein